MTIAMNLMVKKGDWKAFKRYYLPIWGGEVLSANGTIETWLMQPERFFQLMGEWREREEK
jgi:hypothetical protein